MQIAFSSFSLILSSTTHPPLYRYLMLLEKAHSSVTNFFPLSLCLLPIFTSVFFSKSLFFYSLPPSSLFHSNTRHRCDVSAEQRKNGHVLAANWFLGHPTCPLSFQHLIPSVLSLPLQAWYPSRRTRRRSACPAPSGFQ